MATVEYGPPNDAFEQDRARRRKRSQPRSPRPPSTSSRRPLSSRCSTT